MTPGATVAHEVARGFSVTAVVVTGEAQRETSDRAGDFEIGGV